MGLGSIGKALGGVAGGLNLISAGTSALGGIYSANKSAKTSKQLTAQQINWEREQAQNRIQWGVQDAIKAGINPAVAVGQAPNVSGISPSIPDTSGYTSAGKAIQNAIETAIDYNQQKAGEKLAETQGFKNIMEGLESGERTNAIPQQLENQTRDSLTAMANQRATERHMEQQNQLLEQQTVYQSLENAMKAIESEVNSGNYAKAMAYVNMTLDTLKNAGGVAQSFVNPIALWKGAKSAGELKQMISTFKNSNAFKLMNRSRH